MHLLVGHTLRRAGHEVLLAFDGDEALELVRTHAPHLLLFDAQMPRMGGVEALAHLRAGGVTTPAILMSATALPVETGGALTRILNKPFSPPQLLTFVRNTLAEMVLP